MRVYTNKSIGFVNKSLKSWMNECTSEDLPVAACLVLPSHALDWISWILQFWEKLGVQADFDSSFPLRNIHLYISAWMPATPWHCTALHYPTTPWGTCSGLSVWCSGRWLEFMIFIVVTSHLLFVVVCCPACPIVVHQFETHDHLRDRPCTYYHGPVPSTEVLWCKKSFNMYICPFLSSDGLPTSSLPWISFSMYLRVQSNDL